MSRDFYGDAVRAEALRSAQRTVDALQLAAKPDARFDELCTAVSPAQVIRDLMSETLTGAGREASRELEKRCPIKSNNAARIPWQTLAHCRARAAQTRAQTAGGLAGALVPTYNTPTAAPALMSMLVLGRLGCTAVDAPGAANLAWPRVTTSATVAWQPTETTSIGETDQGFGQLSLSPHTVGGYTEMSRVLLLQSNPSAMNTVAENLAGKIGVAIDAVPFAAAGGVAGVPKPLTGTTGVSTVNGAGYTLATGMTAITDIGDALLDSAHPGFAANRLVASLLRQRQEFAGSSLTLWKGALTNGLLHDLPAFSTSNIAASTAFFGAWAYMVLCDFSGGLDIEVNPFANFQTGIVGLRIFATIDLAPIWPSAFTVINGIS